MIDSVAVAGVVAWSWESLKDPILELAGSAAKDGITRGGDSLVKKAKDAWKSIAWQDAEMKYRQNLLSSIRVTKVLGNPTPIEIDKIYTDVYVFDKLSAIRRFNDSLDEDESDVRQKLEERDRIDANLVLEKSINIFILGRPGAGKTTFLKYVAMSACKGLIPRTPIFVSLKDWSDSAQSLTKYIEGRFDVCGFPSPSQFLEAIFRSGKALLLLDGLDEVNDWQDKRSQVIKEIVDFSKKYPLNQYCITCRTAATDYSFENFKYVEVADFTSSQQEAFARQWYGAGPTYTKFLAAWNSPRNSGLKDLGRTPLLLTLLCLAFDETQSFPRRQVDLYQEAINALLRKWDSSRLIVRDDFYKDLSHGQRQQLLETIAAQFYFNSRTVFRKSEISEVSRKFIESLPDSSSAEQQDGEELVRQMEAQHGLLVERAKDLYTFSHLTIQEYFTASYVSKLQSQDVLRQVVKSALNDQKWREVMLYTVAMLPQADSFLEELRRQLLQMRQSSTEVLIFIGHCYAVSQVALNPAARFTGQNVGLEELRVKIESYVGKLRNPTLTAAELAKFTEHIEVLDEFLKGRAGKKGYETSAGVVTAARRFLKSEPLDAAKLLGGYFIRPERFINYFYACRLFMECLEVAITARRDQFLSGVISFDESDLTRIQDIIRG